MYNMARVQLVTSQINIRGVAAEIVYSNRRQPEGEPSLYDEATTQTGIDCPCAHRSVPSQNKLEGKKH